MSARRLLFTPFIASTAFLGWLYCSAAKVDALEGSVKKSPSNSVSKSCAKPAHTQDTLEEITEGLCKLSYNVSGRSSSRGIVDQIGDLIFMLTSHPKIDAPRDRIISSGRIRASFFTLGALIGRHLDRGALKPEFLEYAEQATTAFDWPSDTMYLLSCEILKSEIKEIFVNPATVFVAYLGGGLGLVISIHKVATDIFGFKKKRDEKPAVVLIGEEQINQFRKLLSKKEFS